MNRVLIRSNSAALTGRLRYPGAVISCKSSRVYQSVRLFASNKNHGIDSQDNLVKAKLTLQDGSVFEG